MNERQRKRRRTALIRVLSDLSKDGWRNARFDDYRPLEVELASLERNEAPVVR
jgi:hypothetical protein